MGAGLGGGFENTNELHMMKYDKVMRTKDKEEWEQAADEEHERMVKHAVWQAVPPDKVPKKAKIMTSTWARKKKSNAPASMQEATNKWQGSIMMKTLLLLQ